MNIDRSKMRRRAAIAATCLALAPPTFAITGCGSSSTTSSTATTTGGAASQVLPVTANPISNQSTVDSLNIDSVLVENNADPVTGKTVDDHLEIKVTNTGPTELSGFEVFYTFTDTANGSTESYYLALPTTFTIAPGASRTIHFDATGATDHFPVNKYSLFSTSKNKLDVSVTVSAKSAKPVTSSATKDAGGAEQAD